MESSQDDKMITIVMVPFTSQSRCLDVQARLTSDQWAYFLLPFDSFGASRCYEIGRLDMQANSLLLGLSKYFLSLNFVSQARVCYGV